MFWWYQLPLAAPMLAFFAHVFRQLPRGNLWEFAAATSIGAAIVGGFSGWTYRVNQRSVGSTLEPRRQELVAMLRGLPDEPPAPVGP